jgi:4-amino-4-deoxy-L-arabinose transferase-like glycosyltransferase
LAFDAVLPGSLASNSSTDYLVFYRPVADSLYAGRGLSIDGAAATFWPPGYSLILAGAFHLADVLGITHDRMVDIVRLLSIGAAAVLVLLVFDRLFKWTIALSATALWIVFPLNLFLGKQPNSELPFRVLLFAALLAIVVGVQHRHPAWLALAGGLLGLATLIRPACLLLGALLAVGIALWSWRRHKGLVLGALALVAVNVMVLAPHQIWLNEQTDQMAFVSTNGTAAAIDGLTIGTDADETPVGGFSRGAVKIMADATAQRSRLNSYGDVAKFEVESARSHPVSFADLLAVKSVRAWYASESGTGNREAAVIQLALLTLVVAGIWLARRSGQIGALAAGITIGVPLYFWAVTISVLPLARQMVPSEGLLLPYAALTLHYCAQRIRPNAPSKTADTFPGALHV